MGQWGNAVPGGGAHLSQVFVIAHQSSLHHITSYQHSLFYFGIHCRLLYFLSVSSPIGCPVKPCLSVLAGPVPVLLVDGSSTSSDGVLASVCPAEGQLEPKAELSL